MEKISSILPSNPRIKSVDLKNSNPVRPGVPTFGQREGVNTNKDRLTIGEGDVESARQETLAGYNPKEARHARIASDVTRNFFENRLKTKPVETAAPPTFVDETVRTAAPISDEGADVLASVTDAISETKEAGGESARSLDLYA